LQAPLLQDFALIQLQCVFEPDLFKKNHVCRLALAYWQVDFEHVTVQIIAAIRPEIVRFVQFTFCWKHLDGRDPFLVICIHIWSSMPGHSLEDCESIRNMASKR
jgi:hypothetical protein